MKKILITIGRQSGSGGRRIGIRLGELLNIPCYDEELIKEAAKKGGYSEEVVQSYDEKPSKSFLYSFVMNHPSAGPYHNPGVILPLEQRVFLAQYNTIRELAEQGSAIFVGRCAEYALEEEENVINIFITVNHQDAIAHIEETYGYSLSKAKDFVKKTNKQRSEYYNFYTNKEWGDASNYHLSVNRSVLGIEGTAELIADFIQRKMKEEAEEDQS